MANQPLRLTHLMAPPSSRHPISLPLSRLSAKDIDISGRVKKIVFEHFHSFISQPFSYPKDFALHSIKYMSNKNPPT